MVEIYSVAIKANYLSIDRLRSFELFMLNKEGNDGLKLDTIVFLLSCVIFSNAKFLISVCL